MRGDHRPFRRPCGAPLLALPDRDERLPRHAESGEAAGSTDGPRTCAGAGTREGSLQPRGDLDRADPRPRGCRRRARDDPARVRRRAAAPPAAPARRFDPVRGAPLAGCGGGRAARDHARVGEQRPPACPGDTRRETPSPRPGEVDQDLLERYVAAFEAYDLEALTALIRRTRSSRCRPTTSGCRAARTSSPGGSGRGSAAGATKCSPPGRRTARRRSGSTSRAPTAATSPGR